MPLNEVVLENFWTDKSDVESVLLGTYAALETSDCITRMSLWGEMRSDNMTDGNSSSNDLIQITKENILETNSLMSWKCFYDVINRANTVLHYAPLVQKEDPNYTKAELQANEAEAIALRSLCYWYLIRAYRDVPFVTEPSIDDAPNAAGESGNTKFVVPADSFNVILDNLISDLEGVKNWAVNKYSLQSANTGRITRVAIYAMLADMYLWKGDWQKTIDYAELVTDRKIYEYEELEEEDASGNIVEMFLDKYPLIKSTSGSNLAGTAYTNTFGAGNSFEVLFELYFQDNQSTTNSFISSYYGSRSSSVGNLKVPTDMSTGFNTGANKVFTSKYDGRFYESMKQDASSGDYGIVKYAARSISYNLATGEVQTLTQTARQDGQNPNWIIYRYTDVLLMEAEALVMQGSEFDSNGQTAQRDSVFNKAFTIVNAINQRAICYPQYVNAAADTLKRTAYLGSASTMEELVLDERRRELCFEGKRWFDLVRISRRDGNTNRLLQYILPRHTENQSAIRIKLKDMDAIYFPYSKDELKVNTKLKQNPVYKEDELVNKQSDKK